MAITDIQISEELETGAPSIKYTGNEGPQAPMQMAGADPMLIEQYEKYVYEMLEQGLEPMSFEQFRSMALAGEAKAPTEEVEEEIKEKKVITLAQGGIASLTGA